MLFFMVFLFRVLGFLFLVEFFVIQSGMEERQRSTEGMRDELPLRAKSYEQRAKTFFCLIPYLPHPQSLKCHIQLQCVGSLQRIHRSV